MSSLIRRIARQQVSSQKVHFRGIRTNPVTGKQQCIIESNPPRAVFFMGRGQKLGVTNPKGRELVARKARDAKWGRA